MRNRNIRYQRKEKQDQRKQGQEEIECHRCGTVHQSSFREALQEENQHIVQRHPLEARDHDKPQDVLQLVVPTPTGPYHAVLDIFRCRFELVHLVKLE